MVSATPLANNAASALEPELLDELLSVEESGELQRYLREDGISQVDLNDMDDELQRALLTAFRSR